MDFFKRIAGLFSAPAPTSPRGNFGGLDCEVVVGDLTDRGSLKPALGVTESMSQF